MSRAIRLIIIISLILVAGAMVVYFSFFNKNNNSAAVLDTVQKTVTLVIDDSDQKLVQYKLEANPASTVYSLLQESGAKVEIKKYSFGVLVASINGVKNGQDNKFWIYYLNDELGTIGADSQKVKAGDIILWRFEKNKF